MPSLAPTGPARSKTCPRYQRLFEATLSAARYNLIIRAIYRRLNEEGRPGKVARIAAARKLLLLAHAIYESGEPFRATAEEVT